MYMVKMEGLNKLANEILGKPMTKKERQLLEVLRRKVKSGQITVDQAREVWRERVNG